MKSALRVMSPHTDYFDRSMLRQDLVNQTVLNVDATGISAFQVASQLFKGRRLLKGVLLENVQQRFSLRAESRSRKLPGVLSRLSGKEKLPPYHPGVFAQRFRGVRRPCRMDSRMPGMETRYRVSMTARQSSSETRTALARLPVIWMGS